MVEDNSSYGGGFALGFLLGIIGVIIALAVGTSGSKIRRGAGHGLLTYIIVCVVGFILLLATASGGYWFTWDMIKQFIFQCAIIVVIMCVEESLWKK